MKQILMLATGGTIACQKTAHGLAPALSGEALLNLLPELSDRCLVTVENPMCMDSTDLMTEHRIRLATLVWENYARYDGFVIAHGTDTMAYTAALLSHMLRDLDKPVILTGAQIPAGEPGADALHNLLDAFRVACAGYPGVAVVFCGRIIRGRRAVKVHTSDLDAFRSVNAPQDGQITADGRVLLQNAPRPTGTPHLVMPTPQRLFLVRLTPDMDPALFALLPGAGYDKVVLEAFGAGGVPAHLEQAVRGILKAGVTVYVTSGCLYGACDLHKYAVGQRAEAMGAICLGDRTIEDALAAIACGEI